MSAGTRPSRVARVDHSGWAATANCCNANATRCGAFGRLQFGTPPGRGFFTKCEGHVTYVRFSSALLRDAHTMVCIMHTKRLFRSGIAAAAMMHRKHYFFAVEGRSQACLPSRAAKGACRTRQRTPLGLELYLHSALAFVGNSLYRTRRFRSLCATAVLCPDCTASETGQKTTGTHGPFRGFCKGGDAMQDFVAIKLDNSDMGRVKTDPGHVTSHVTTKI